MGKIYINGVEYAQFGSVINMAAIKEGIQFSETTIGTDDNGVIQLTDDYNDYDFIKFVVYNSTDSRTTVIFSTPAHINAILNIASNQINFNEWNNNNYCCYTISGDTWTKNNVFRRCNLNSIIGVNCTSHTVHETKIFEAEARSSTAVSVSTEENVYDSYDYIMFSANSSDATEVQPSANVFETHPSNDFLDIGLSNESSRIHLFNGYNNVTNITIGDNSFSNAKYFYISGIKFV